ncbi:C2 domain-containing protein, partial [Pelagophyceae sp. CCMP2097]
GSSDPRLRLSVVGTKDLKATSKTCKKTLAPCWRQTFELPFRASDYREGDAPVEFGQHGPLLSVVVEDVDEVTSSDFMGRLDIPLLPFGKDKKRGRAWHSLQADSGAESSNVDGERPNELRIAIVQGRGLAVKDKNLLSKGGTSDPFVRLSIEGGGEAPPCQTDVKRKTLTPVWNAIFQMPLKRDSKAKPRLRLVVEDYDDVSAADFMGMCSIELNLLLEDGFSGLPTRKWHALKTEEGQSANVTGDLEVWLQWW